ncbi:hypothetical protein FG386_000567 [Cryptosporidium ryanae]|uniref:uncharacterized protein n=1 Tax=Cryptosporidium ryanae TaxID=515981 RepID=UPI00351A9DB0|nr:hypothetical protein FG386_000567 [Cryptosporidium ryanae]
MNKDKWYVNKFLDYKVKRNTNINNIANISEEDAQCNYFDLSDDIGKSTLHMCYEFYSTFDYEGKGYIPLKLLEEWSKIKNESLQKSDGENTKKYDRYKLSIQKMCNSIESYKNKCLSRKNVDVDEEKGQKIEAGEETNKNNDTILITVSEFIHFCAPIFDEISSSELSIKNKMQPKVDSIHFKTLTESNISLTNYFGTATNISLNGKFIPLSSSPSSYLEPTCNNAIKGVSIPIHNPALYVTDSNLYHSSLWSPCTNDNTASLLTWNKYLNDIQNR